MLSLKEWQDIEDFIKEIVRADYKTEKQKLLRETLIEEYGKILSQYDNQTICLINDLYAKLVQEYQRKQKDYVLRAKKYGIMYAEDGEEQCLKL